MAYTIGTESLTQIYEGLHDDYIKGVKKAYFTDVFLLNKFKKEDHSGRRYLIKYEIGGGFAGGAYDERATLPTAEGRKFLEGNDKTKFIYLPFDLTGPEIYQANGTGQHIDMLKTAYQRLEDNGKWLLETMFWGNGSGRIAQVNGTPTYSTNTTITVDNGSIFWIKPYQKVNYGTDTTAYEVLSVDTDNNQFVLEGDVRTEFADDVWIYRNKAYQADLYNDPLGIAAHVASSNPPYTSNTYQGLNRTTVGHEFLKAHMSDHGSVALTMLSLKQFIDKIKQQSGGKVPTNLVTEDGVFNSYFLLLMANHLNADTVVDKAGLVRALQFVYLGKGIEIEVTDFCPEGYLYALNMNYLYVKQSRPLQWDQTYGNPKMQRSETKDVFIGRMIWYYNTYCSNNLAQGAKYNILRNSITS